MKIHNENTGIPLSRGSHTDWVESSIVLKNRKNSDFLGVTISARTRGFFLACILSILALFFVRAIELQVIKGSGFAGLSARNQVREYRIDAKRGTFSDRNGKRLVSNAPNFVVRLNPSEVARDTLERANLAYELSRILSIPLPEVHKIMESAFEAGSRVILKENIPRAEALLTAARLADIDGVELVSEEMRRYEFDGAQSLSHIIGYTGRISKKEYKQGAGTYQLNDIIGKDGLESVYENELRGVFGVKKVEIDARGTEQSIIADSQAIDGKNITLAIDYKLQKISEQTLRKVLKKFKTSSGVVIVSLAHTGEMLAMVSLPSYDANLFARGITRGEYQALTSNAAKPLFPRAIRGEYPPGSTIKMIIAAAALEERLVSPLSTVMSKGGLRVGKWFFPDWKIGGHGRTDIAKALAESVNTFFYMIGGGYKEFQGLGINRIEKYLTSMGLGAITGIDLPSEEQGFIPNQEWKKNIKGETWYIGDTYHTSIGQGDITVTPLQVHAYTSYFANNGISYVPRIVNEIRDADIFEGVSTPQRVLKSGIFRKETIEQVRNGLRQGALTGSSRRLSSLPFTSAGKTGTAQWKKNSPPHAWFTGWAPYENPEIVITVLVEQGEEGSKSAIAVAYDVLQWYFLDKASKVK